MKKLGFLAMSIITLMVISLFVLGCAKTQEIKPQAAETAAASPAATPSAPAGETQPTAETAAPAETPGETVQPTSSVYDKIDSNVAGATGDESQLKELETNTNILEKKTIWGRAMEQKRFEETTWFEAVNCKRYLGESQGYYRSTGTKKEDKVSFRLKNNDKRQYFLGFTKVLETIHRSDKDTSKVPMVLRINGQRIREVKECCGTDILEPGQTLECKDCKANLRYDEDQKYMLEKTQMKNNLEAVSDYLSTQVVFECRK